ncbi:MAG: hypothetical protein ACR2N7_07030, partial [Acidimicrobiia bacterium]
VYGCVATGRWYSMFNGRRYVMLGLLALIASLLAIAAPAVGAPPGNPFVGSWVSDDLPPGTELRLQISASGQFHTWDEEVISGSCIGGLVTAKGQGDFDGDTFTTDSMNRTCIPGGGGAFGLANLPFDLEYVYDAATDTLELTIDGSCYYRTGTDPSVCV